MLRNPRFVSRRRLIASRLLFALALAVLSVPAQATGWPMLTPDPALASFLSVYAHYVSAIQARGLDGFKGETAPGFIVRHDRDRWAGAAAFAQVHWWLAGSRGGKVAVTIRRLTIVGTTAVVWTREAVTYPLPPDATATGAVDLRQVWRQSGGRWRLAVQEWVSGKAVAPPPPVAWTVSADGGPAPTVTTTQVITRP